MAEARELKDEAARHFARGRFHEAAAIYAELCAGEPNELQLRVRLGDALVKVGDKDAAVAAYRVAAESYAREGFLPRAIAVCKLILEVEPDHRATQVALAQLYARRASRPSSALKPEAAEQAPLELDITKRHFRVGEEAEVPAPEGSESGLELEDPSGPAPAWKGAPWAPPIRDLAPAPASAYPAVGTGEPESESTGCPAPSSSPGPHEPNRSAEGRSSSGPGDSLAPENPHSPGLRTPPAASSQQFHFTELDLDESDLADLPAARQPKPSSEPKSASAREEGAAKSPAGGGSGASPPFAPASLAELRIDPADEEDEDIEILVDPTELSVGAARLPRLPLFSDLSREAFVELASQCRLRRFAPGEAVIEEGGVGASFFVIGSGSVRITKRRPEGEKVLARLKEGSFFGEMALLSGSPRAASVVAAEPTELLEISAQLLSNLLRRYPGVAAVLKRFCRERLLANVLTLSPLFAQFSGEERRRLFARFKARAALPKERILEEGRPSDGLYVVLTGAFEVTKAQGDQQQKLALLREGDLFGEISLLTKGPATASVIAVGRATLLKLSREAFNELICTHPQILALVSELSDERLRLQQASGAVQAGPTPGIVFL
jgi:CRP-like cAMP-binding protein